MPDPNPKNSIFFKTAEQPHLMPLHDIVKVYNEDGFGIVVDIEEGDKRFEEPTGDWKKFPELFAVLLKVPALYWATSCNQVELKAGDRIRVMKLPNERKDVAEEAQKVEDAQKVAHSSPNETPVGSPVAGGSDVSRQPREAPLPTYQKLEEQAPSAPVANSSEEITKEFVRTSSKVANSSQNTAMAATPVHIPKQQSSLPTPRATPSSPPPPLPTHDKPTTLAPSKPPRQEKERPPAELDPNSPPSAVHSTPTAPAPGEAPVDASTGTRVLDANSSKSTNNRRDHRSPNGDNASVSPSSPAARRATQSSPVDISALISDERTNSVSPHDKLSRSVSDVEINAFWPWYKKFWAWFWGAPGNLTVDVPAAAKSASVAAFRLWYKMFLGRFWGALKKYAKVPKPGQPSKTTDVPGASVDALVANSAGDRKHGGSLRPRAAFTAALGAVLVLWVVVLFYDRSEQGTRGGSADLPTLNSSPDAGAPVVAAAVSPSQMSVRYPFFWSPLFLPGPPPELLERPLYSLAQTHAPMDDAGGYDAMDVGAADVGDSADVRDIEARDAGVVADVIEAGDVGPDNGAAVVPRDAVSAVQNAQSSSPGPVVCKVPECAEKEGGVDAECVYEQLRARVRKAPDSCLAPESRTKLRKLVNADPKEWPCVVKYVEEFVVGEPETRVNLQERGAILDMLGRISSVVGTQCEGDLDRKYQRFFAARKELPQSGRHKKPGIVNQVNGGS